MPRPLTLTLSPRAGRGERAADIRGREADIMTLDSLHPRLRKRIEETAVRVF